MGKYLPETSSRKEKFFFYQRTFRCAYYWNFAHPKLQGNSLLNCHCRSRVTFKCSLMHQRHTLSFHTWPCSHQDLVSFLRPTQYTHFSIPRGEDSGLTTNCTTSISTPQNYRAPALIPPIPTQPFGFLQPLYQHHSADLEGLLSAVRLRSKVFQWLRYKCVFWGTVSVLTSATAFLFKSWRNPPFP